MEKPALESQSHDQDVKVDSSTTAIKGGAPISPKPFISTADLEADMRNEWKSIQDQKNAEKKAKKTPSQKDAGRTTEPKDPEMLKELESKLKSQVGEEDQSVDEVKEEAEEEILKTDSESDTSEEDSKEKDKPKKSSVQHRMDRLFARTKEAESKSDKLLAEKFELQKQLEIYQKEYQHLLSVAKEDPKDVQLRKFQYDKEMEDFKRTSQEQLKAEKAKMLKEVHFKQQEEKIFAESEALSEKYFTVSSEEILIKGGQDLNKPLEQIAKELHISRMKKALSGQEKKVSAPKTTANVGQSIKQIDFEDTPDGWRQYLRSKGRDI